MLIPITPVTIVGAVAIGSLSAFLAHKRKRNPYFWFAIGFLFGIFGIFAIFFASAKRSPRTNARAKPILTLQGPADKFWYYLDATNAQQGPMSRDALTAAWKQGKLTPATYIWHEELANWQPLESQLKMQNANSKTPN